MSSPTRSAEVRRFLRTGDHDSLLNVWPGRNFLEQARAGSEALLAALVEEVRRRESDVSISTSSVPCADELTKFARRKLEPMVRGLFPRAEQDVVLALLERSVAFLEPGSVEAHIRHANGLGTSWQVANVYLGGIGADPLADELSNVVGLSVETTCYISLAYFSSEDPFADHVVHEAAHIFHNTKRRTLGLTAR